MGIVAPRAVHARLYINGEYQGVVAAVEDVDGRFTANRFLDSGDGNLYRDLWPSKDATLADMKEGLRTNDDPGVVDVSDFVAFKDAVVASTDATFALKVGPFVDFEQLSKYILVDRAINNFDGIMSFYYSCQGYTSYFDNVSILNGVTTQGGYGVREIDCDPFLKMLRGEIYDRQKAISDAFITGRANLPKFHANVSLMMSGLVSE